MRSPFSISPFQSIYLLSFVQIDLLSMNLSFFTFFLHKAAVEIKIFAVNSEQEKLNIPCKNHRSNISEVFP